jgi:hypothetical protein
VRDLGHDAGAVCRRINHKFKQLRAPTASRAQDVAFLASGISRLGEQLTQLRRIPPPHDVADVYHAALSALGQELLALHAAVKAIHQGEDPAMAYRMLKQQLTPLESQVNDAWRALQVADCLQ